MLEFFILLVVLLVMALTGFTLVAMLLVSGLFVLLGALGGMLCDMGANTFYGFYTLTLFLYGAAVGLALIYLMKNDRKTAVLCCLVYTGGMALIEYIFYYLLYGFAGNWQVLLFQLTPRVLYTYLVMPLFYFGERKLFDYFSRRTEEI